MFLLVIKLLLNDFVTVGEPSTWKGCVNEPIMCEEDIRYFHTGISVFLREICSHSASHSVGHIFFETLIYLSISTARIVRTYTVQIAP